MEILRSNPVIRVIRSDDEYKAALAEIERLIDRNPPARTPDAEKLEVLTLVVQDYEQQRIESRAHDPIEAIKFRMEQQNLTPRDLVPFIGSRSKVSEVLSRKRPLTLSMIRALHRGFGIPASALLQQQALFDFQEAPIEWDRFPLREMIARGWIKEKVRDLRGQSEQLLRNFLAPIGSVSEALAMYKQTRYVRSARQMDEYALTAWTARIIIRALEAPTSTNYRPGVVDMRFMQELARLSTFDTGPRLAQEYLARHGICLIIESHLPRTHLDGAAILIEGARPVIGLTLRHDRIDNFWFVLMHELAHIARHLSKQTSSFYDDLDVGDQGDQREKEADQLAGEALIPEIAWRNSPARNLRTPDAVQHLATQLRIHPAIVAGRIRHHHKSFRVLNQFVGHGQVRRLFPEVYWPSGN
jgi:HTH-type transcriptional regulator/antitoxin HigA